MGICTNRGSARREQLLAVGTYKCPAVTAAKQVRLADVLVNAARSRRQVCERVLRPIVRTIVLRIGDSPAFKLHYPHRHAWIGKHFFWILILWRAPPFNDMRPSSPAPQQKNVGFGGRTKAVS
jgi:hypothetical protein